MNNQILIISTEFPPGPGGIGQHAYSLSKALSNHDYKIHVLAPADYATIPEVNQFDDKQIFTITRYPRKGYGTYLNRIRITLLTLKQSKAKTVFLSGKFSLWQGLIIKQFFPNVKTIAILHGSEVNLANRLLRYLTHQSIASANIIIAVSNFTKSLLPSWILKSCKNIVVIPNGIDPINTEEIHQRNTVLNGYPKLITVGHVSPRKGQHRVIKALPKLIQRWPQIHYHLIGRPESQTTLEILARQLDVSKHITFHGRIADYNALASFYKQADVFMLLSENQIDGDVEGFGIVALEANQLGVPVVGAKYCGVEEAVKHLLSGYLVDGNNPSEIEEGVEYCLSHSDTFKVGTQAWAKQHQWSAIVKKYTNLLC